MIDLLHWIVVFAVFVRVFCVARNMDANTPVRARVQHGCVLILAGLSLPVFIPDSWAPILLGLALWLHMAIERRQKACP